MKPKLRWRHPRAGHWHYGDDKYDYASVMRINPSALVHRHGFRWTSNATSFQNYRTLAEAKRATERKLRPRRRR